MWLIAPPDDGLCTVTVPKVGDAPQLHWLGTNQMYHHAPQDIRNWPVLHVALSSRGRLEMPLPRCLINYIADVDMFERTLTLAESVARQMGVPCFNPPAAIRNTRRDTVSELLQGIDGLVVPKTIRLASKHPGDFANAFAEHGFQYPVIVRMAGSHGGRTQTLIEDASQWDRVHALPWGGAHVYLTQFHDCRGSDGLYRKLRLAFVGGRVIPRHYVAGDSWVVHAADRVAEELEAELRWLAAFDQELGAQHRAAFDEIYRRVGLDYFGMDCGVLSDGRLVLFEANPTMAILRNTPPHEAAFAPVVQRLVNEVFALVRDTRRWVWKPAPTPPASPVQ
jgi:glutathione synthase/RimK-type ligase-like ATP-grasp enzyme